MKEQAMPKRFLFFPPFSAACLMLLLLALIVSPALADAHTDQILTLVNAQRGTPLSMNPQLVAAAQLHSDWMAACGIFSHTGGGGSSVGDRAQASGYNWSQIGENILFQSTFDANAAFNGWWNSPPHKANMLDANFVDVGIAYALGSDGFYYYTMVLGKPLGGSASGSVSTSCGSGGSSGGGGGGTTPTGGEVPSSSISLGAGNFSGNPRLNANDSAAPIGIFCSMGINLNIWTINLNNSQGTEVINVTLSQIGAAVDQARSTGLNVLLGSFADVSAWALISNEIQIQANDLREPNKKYVVVIPANSCGEPVSGGTVPIVNSGTDAVTGGTNTTNSSGGAIHVVQPGETLFRIALRYGVTLSQLAAANNIANPARIFVGQQLVIPGGTTITTPTTPSNTALPVTTPAASGQTHVVRPGENLFRIALRYNVTLSQLAAFNGISNPALIFVGQVLRIPDAP